MVCVSVRVCHCVCDHGQQMALDSRSLGTQLGIRESGSSSSSSNQVLFFF